jgi:hypothetical protein
MLLSQTLRVPENRVPRRITRPKREEIIEKSA